MNSVDGYRNRRGADMKTSRKVFRLTAAAALTAAALAVPASASAAPTVRPAAPVVFHYSGKINHTMSNCPGMSMAATM
jgi:hypothetical protein